MKTILITITIKAFNTCWVSLKVYNEIMLFLHFYSIVLFSPEMKFKTSGQFNNITDKKKERENLCDISQLCIKQKKEPKRISFQEDETNLKSLLLSLTDVSLFFEQKNVLNIKSNTFTLSKPTNHTNQSWWRKTRTTQTTRRMPDGNQREREWKKLYEIDKQSSLKLKHNRWQCMKKPRRY